MIQVTAGAVWVTLAGFVVVGVFLCLVRRCWPPARLRPINDIVGAYGGVIGTMYAVILAFMLSGVWSNLNDASANAEQEANAVVQVFRLAEQFPAPERHAVRQSAIDYVRAVIDIEWNDMARGEIGPEGKRAFDRLWRAVLSIHPRDGGESAAVAQMLTVLSDATRHRAQRELEARLSLPPVLWWVLVVGGVITIGILSLFGVDDWRLHAMKSASLSVLICLMLAAVADIDRPFQGAVRVTPEAFHLAQSTFERLQYQN
jgi:hypothetical protein